MSLSRIAGQQKKSIALQFTAEDVSANADYANVFMRIEWEGLEVGDRISVHGLIEVRRSAEGEETDIVRWNLPTLYGKTLVIGGVFVGICDSAGGAFVDPDSGHAFQINTTTDGTTEQIINFVVDCEIIGVI